MSQPPLIQPAGIPVHLVAQDESFVTLGNLLPYPIWLADREGKITYFNQRVYQYAGLTPQTLHQENWLDIVHPEDRELNIERWVHSVTTGDPFFIEHRLLRFDGVYRWHLSQGTPYRNAAGQIEIWVGTTTDIEQHKQFSRELEDRVNERTVELQRKNEELEQFGFAASHDMQEPLRKIKTFVSMLLAGNESLNEQQTRLLGKIDAAAFRMQNMINDMLNYSRHYRDGQGKEPTDLNLIVQQVLTDLELIAREKKAKLIVDRLPTVSVIPTQITQLFFNLLHNALKFSRPDTEPIIQVRCHYVSPEQWIGNTADTPAVYLSVSDNGIGFPQKYAEKIFQLFERLHAGEGYEGTGIGLSLCKRVVENHRGKITVLSAPGAGTTFTVMLPLS